MATEEQLLEGLRAADAAGNTEDAQAFADQIKSLRGGGQPSGVAAPLGDAAGPGAELDPYEGAPRSIQGIELTPEMRDEWLKGTAIEDPEERATAEAAFNGRLQSADQAGGLGEGALNAFTSAFDILGVPSAVGTAVGGAIKAVQTGNGSEVRNAFARQRAYRAAQREKFGKSTLGATLAGDIVGGGLLIKGGLKAAGKLGGKELVEKATVFAKQKGFKSAMARLAVGSTAGAVEGAIVEGLRKGEPVTGATLGLLAGPFGEALPLLAKVTTAITPGFVKAAVRSPETRGLKLLADKVGETHEEMVKRFTRFSAIFGRPPSMAELGDSQFNTEIAEVINDSVKSSIAAREGVLAIQGRAARETSEAVTRGVTPATVVGQTAAQKKIADDAFRKVRGEVFEFEGDDIGRFLEDDDIMGLVPKEARKDIREQIKAATDDEGALIGSVTLDGAFVDDLRLALGAAAKGGKGFPRKFLEAQEELMGLAGEQSDTLSQAVGQFAKRSRRIEGLEQGRAAVTGKTSELVEGVSRTTDPNILAAQRQGLRAELGDVALGGPAGAAKVTSKLASDTGLQDRMQAILPEKQFKALVETGEVGTRARRSLNELTPQVRKDADKALGSLTDAVLVASPQIPASASVLAVGRLLKHKGLGIDRRVAENLIRDLYDPTKTKEVVDLMLARGLSHNQVAGLLTVGLGAASASRQGAIE